MCHQQTTHATKQWHLLTAYVLQFSAVFWRQNESLYQEHSAGVAKGINNIAAYLTIFWFCKWKYCNVQFVSVAQEDGAQPTDAIYMLASHTRSVLAAIQYDSLWRNILSLAKRHLWWEFISICQLVNGAFLSVSTGCIFQHSLCTVTFLHTKPASTGTIHNRCLSDSNDKRDALYYTYWAVGKRSATNWLVTLLEQ